MKSSKSRVLPFRVYAEEIGFLDLVTVDEMSCPISFPMLQGCFQASVHSPAQHSAVQCGAVRCGAVQCSAVQFSAVQCSSVRFSPAQLSSVQFSSV